MTCLTAMRGVTLCAILLLVSGCGALSVIGGATTPPAVFEVRAPADGPVVSGRPRALDIIIEVPTTGGALETDRIMIRPSPLEAQYLPDVRWSAPAPQMLQTAMLRTLDASRAFQYVGRRPLGAGGDFAVVTELVDFQAELGANGNAAEVVVRMVARIVREDGVRIVATRTFAARQPAASLDDTTLVQAFDAATSRILAEFAAWALSSLGAR